MINLKNFKHFGHSKFNFLLKVRMHDCTLFKSFEILTSSNMRFSDILFLPAKHVIGEDK